MPQGLLLARQHYAEHIAEVLTAIKDVLDELPRVYTKELYEEKCDTVYQHFYEAYVGEGKSFYAVR